MSEYYLIDFGVNYANKNKYTSANLNKLVSSAWNNGVEKMICISNSIKEAKSMK